MVLVRDADALMHDGRQHRRSRYLRVAGGSRGVEEPEHACDLFMLRTGRSRGRPCLSMMPRPGWFGGWRVGENDALNWPHCDVLNWPHLRVRS